MLVNHTLRYVRKPARNSPLCGAFSGNESVVDDSAPYNERTVNSLGSENIGSGPQETQKQLGNALEEFKGCIVQLTAGPESIELSGGVHGSRI